MLRVFRFAQNLPHFSKRASYSNSIELCAGIGNPLSWSIGNEFDRKESIFTVPCTQRIDRTLIHAKHRSSPDRVIAKNRTSPHTTDHFGLEASEDFARCQLRKGSTNRFECTLSCDHRDRAQDIRLMLRRRKIWNLLKTITLRLIPLSIVISGAKSLFMARYCIWLGATLQSAVHEENFHQLSNYKEFL